MFVYMCVYMSMCMCVYVCVHIDVHICMHMCMCIYMCEYGYVQDTCPRGGAGPQALVALLPHRGGQACEVVVWEATDRGPALCFTSAAASGPRPGRPSASGSFAHDLRARV